MKALNYLFTILLMYLTLGACTSENSLSTDSISTTVSTRSGGRNLDKPYITRPDLPPHSTQDTTNTWIFDIEVNRYVNGALQYGKAGRYTQLQYSKGSLNDWTDVTIQAENPIYVQKKNYPFGTLFFRARTMEKEELSKIDEAKQYQYSTELSPWSEPLCTINNIYNGVSLTNENVVIAINFSFYLTGDLPPIAQEMFSFFSAEITEGDHKISIPNPQVSFDKPNGFRYTYCHSIRKRNYPNLTTMYLTIVNRSKQHYISFEPYTFPIYIKWEQMTQPYTIDIHAYVEGEQNKKYK